eukprot:3938186-Rhodomonas_salina.1
MSSEGSPEVVPRVRRPGRESGDCMKKEKGRANVLEMNATRELQLTDLDGIVLLVARIARCTDAWNECSQS